MKIEFIEGEHIERSMQLCYNFLKQKYIREVLNKEKDNTKEIKQEVLNEEKKTNSGLKDNLHSKTLTGSPHGKELLLNLLKQNLITGSEYEEFLKDIENDKLSEG